MKSLTFGQRAMTVMAQCPELCVEADLPMGPVVLFFSALAMIDRHALIMSSSSRRKALLASADFVRSSQSDEARAMQSMIDDFALQAAEGRLDYLTPLDLLMAAANRSKGAIEAGLGSVAVALGSLLSTVESTIPSQDLADDPPAMPPRQELKYAVVIEGPGFRDDRNRYATVDIAQRAARAFECRIRGEDIVLEPHAAPFGMTSPPELRSATRVYVTEI